MQRAFRQRVSPLLALLFFVLVPAARADSGEAKVTLAIQKLNRQMDLLDFIKPYVERPDLGRLLVLRNSSRGVLSSITEKGPFSKSTMQQYQHLIITYRYSRIFFKNIATGTTTEAIKEATEITEYFAKEFEFDDSPSTKITLSVFSQLYQLTLQLLQLTLTPELHAKLEEAKAPIGEMMALAQEGDNDRTFQAAIPRCRQIKALYPYFYKVAASDAAFELTLEMQGLVEWYIERSGIPLGVNP